ncbi:arginine N-succinyltransferase [Parashewanella curva]|uniref:Arginine N-succinyltransferase n=1 Tax=Parashewanella curva TaxID=2338552 RepID=A0A3L8PRV8_9GAMM|nr:arginine N-succinyltransferase [Parashewanella curva]RLV58125.1 arginine N-succinyltransferase [Parashewanella curva]
MLVIRPIRSSDLDALMQIAIESGHGFTSLPVNEELLRQKIARAEASFKKPAGKPHDEVYFLVLEDTETGEIVGTTAIEAAVGLVDAFYHYRLGTEVYHSEQIGVRNEVETLTLCHDYTGAAELCSLFLRENYRKDNNGRLLSRCRFLFLAENKDRFGSPVIAEMRGVSDANGESPFYGWLQKFFIGIDFIKADYLSGLGQKGFMAEMMPRNPIYTCLLSEEARAVIKEVHTSTLPALKLLESEGFTCRGYVDIFDGGPTVECDLENIRGVRDSQVYTVKISQALPEDGNKTIVANTRLADFRAIQASLVITDGSDEITLTPEIADALMVAEGDTVRLLSN